MPAMNETGEVVEIQQPADATTANAPATPPNDGTPPTEGDVTKQDAPEKVFTQKELDEILQKRLARERRAFEKELRDRQPAAEPASTPEKLDPSKFETWEAYAEALAEQKAGEKVRKAQADMEARTLRSSFEDREEAAREKYADYDTVARNVALPVSETTARLLMKASDGPDLLYHLGQNPSEAARIFRLSPEEQGFALGEIRAKLASVGTAPAAKKVSNAPAPISPVTVKGGAASIVKDTTDPRSASSMSTEEWIRAENERVRNRNRR